MKAKVGFVVVCTALAMSGMGRFESLVAHRGLSGATAFAQDWADGADNSSEPKSVPNIAGTYTGNVDDHVAGSGGATVIINQNGSTLSGSFSTFFNHGSLTGKVKPNSKVHLRLKVSGNCGANFQGIFVGGNEIKGVYSVTGCKGSDHGHLQVSD